MMNFSYYSFATAVQLVAQDMAYESYALTQQDASPFNEARRAGIKNHIEYLSRKCGELLLERADARLQRVSLMLSRHYSRAELVQELEALLQAIDDDIRLEYFLHYRRDKGKILLMIPGDWTATLAAFPSARDEIEEGVDCYALEHNTACVFHIMRVAELGLRALGRERGVSFPKIPLEWANWQNILEQTEAKARAATRAMSAGPAKDAALAFYSGAIGQIHAFKDTYRNAVMHARKRYTEVEALRAINQVRDFMNGLSSKIDEKTKRPIRRWA
jgi:hypothetical protein